MSLEYSITTDEATQSAFSLQAMPLNLSYRQMLSILENESGFPGTAKIVRQIIRQELCTSVLNLVRLPATATRGSVRVLLCPGTLESDCPDNMPMPRPTVYVIHENRDVRYWQTDAIIGTVGSGQVDWCLLNLALADLSRLSVISDSESRALRRAEAPQDLQFIRRCRWDHHVGRLRMKPRHGRDLRLVVNSARYFDGITDMVVTPLLDEIRLIEQRLIKAFLFPMHETLVRPRTAHRPTKNERRRNRQQAVESYPFLEDLWYTDTKVESPLANSLILQLDALEKRQLRLVIDEGRPIREVLCLFLRLDPWMIDHLRTFWPAYLEFDRGWYPDRQWDLGAFLALWTRETAPKTLDELNRLNDLSHRMNRRTTPFYRTIQTPISPDDRRRLRRLVVNDSDARSMQSYLDFLESLTDWIAKHCGQNVDDNLPQLLGVETLDDWWVMARRWHAINAKLQRSAGKVDPDQTTPIHIEWPPLLKSAENFGPFTFESINSYARLVVESEQMQNCASTYVLECATGESHMIHLSQDGEPIGTVAVRKAMYSDNRKILLVHAEAADHTPLSADAEQALEQFLDACNGGRIAFAPDALLPRSLRLELLAPMLQTQCIDYPTWVRAGLSLHYFDLHAQIAGPEIIEHYRATLELQIAAKDSLYQLALRAVKQSRTRKAYTQDNLEQMVGAY